MEEAPTKEVVKALLDYLVDPLLPLTVSNKDPPLETQEAVAKQMHAVVLLYNYYHRLQNLQLEVMEFGAFCKLAVTLKPTLIAHMKYMQQADLIGPDDMENHLSITEKAIKDACKIALALTSLKDVSHVERWPVSKVSVLLIDPKKEKCLLSFDTITNGVWSVIEKCLNCADLSPEGPSKGKHTNKRKRKAGKELTGEPIDGELAYQRIAISAVKEATGLKQSEITVLEKHVTYSLSEENMAAYFYIVQSTQSSNEDNQLPIKTVLESLQGPLLKWTSNDWILTQKIEYYNVLPYAQIMSDWVSRECLSVCSQTLNLSGFGGAEKDSETEAVEIEKVNSICLHNLVVELENTNTNSSQRPENSNDGEAQDNMESICGNQTGANSRSNEPSGAYTSNQKEKVDEKEKSDKKSPEKPNDLAPDGADNSNRKEVGDEEKHDNFGTEKPTNKEIKENRGSVFWNCTEESNEADSSRCVEKVDEKPTNKEIKENRGSVFWNCTEESNGADSSRCVEKVDEKPTNKEIKENRGSVFWNCTEESNGADSSRCVEKVDEKPTNKEIKENRGSVFWNCTEESNGADSSRCVEKVDEKPTTKEIKENRGNVFWNCTEESNGADSSRCVEKVDEKEKPDKKSAKEPSVVEPTGPDTSNRKEVVDEEKSDKCTLQKPSDMEIQVNKGRMCGNCSSTSNPGKESIGVEISYMEEVVDEIPDKHSPEFSSDGEITGVDCHNRNEEADSKGKPDNNAPEKHCDRDIQDNVHGDCTDVESCGKVSIGEESSNKEEVDTEEKPDKSAPEMPSDVEPTRAERLHRNSNDADDLEKPDEITPEKPSNTQSKDNKGNIYESCMGPNSCSEKPTGADSFNRKEFDDKEKHDECYNISKSNSTSSSNADTGALKMISAEEPETIPNFSSKRQKTSDTGAFNRKEFDDKEKHDECYNISKSNSISSSNADTGALKMISAEEPETIPNFSSKRQKTSRGGENRNGSMPIRVYHHQKRKLSVESGPGSSAAVVRCNMETSEAKKSFGNEFVVGKVASACIQGYLSSHLNDIPAENTALVPYEPNANDAGKLQTLLASKETEISETALRVLLQKREEMCYQQRMLEDKIASCSRDIRKIIDGDQDALALKLEAMIDCCNDTCLKGKNQIEGVIYQSDVRRTGQCSGKNIQSDSILNVQSSCQELDDMCRKNNWRLPVYLILAVTGGFIAKITMKEMDFDLSYESELQSTPYSARDSAAALMLVKLRHI